MAVGALFAMYLGFFLPLLAWLFGPAAAVSTYYCSSVNTGSSNAANVSVYQSNGLCESHCQADYAFGILQGKKCWCSNIAPNKATNSDDSDCDDSCPGYPKDYCGNASKGLFYYLELDNVAPSGTATAPSSASSTGTSTNSDKTGTSATTTTGGSTVAVETVSGEARTVTVGNSPDSTSPGTVSKEADSGGSGLGGGAIAGVVVGSIGGVAAIAALAFVIFWKRRQQPSSPDNSARNTLVDGRNSKGSQMSYLKGVFSDHHSHTMSAGSSISPGRSPMFTDDRMKDAPMWPGGRRNSSVSLQDNEDYSRPVLRLTNPD